MVLSSSAIDVQADCVLGRDRVYIISYHLSLFLLVPKHGQLAIFRLFVVLFIAIYGVFSSHVFHIRAYSLSIYFLHISL